jgi:hypothetical protein
MYGLTCILTPYIHVAYVMSHATTQICSCMCRMQLKFSCKQQLQNPKFLVMYFIVNHWWLLMVILLMIINGYCIINYCWLLYVILQLLLIIIL